MNNLPIITRLTRSRPLRMGRDPHRKEPTTPMDRKTNRPAQALGRLIPRWILSDREEDPRRHGENRTQRPGPKRQPAVTLLTIVLATVLVTSAHGAGPASPHSTTAASLRTRDRITCRPAQGETVTIATAKLIIEYNSTDEDIGVHGAFDDHGWSELCVYDPNGKQVLAVKPQAQLKDLTMAGIFFESREPPAEEFSFEDLKAKFPEGQYQVRGITFDGEGLTGSATFTHDVPAPPTVTAPLEGAVVPITDLVIEWEDATETIEGEPVTITAYEVIVTKVEHEDPHGFSQPIFDVHVPADRNTLGVPVEFLEPGTEYELEVLALEVSGNQTITVSFFTTE